MTPHRTRRAVFAILIVVAVLIPVWASLAPGNKTTPEATLNPAGGCDHWCGPGSATVTVGTVTTTIPGGGCFDEGALGVDARFGDWELEQADYVAVTYYRPGGATPVPSVADPSSDYPSYPVGGSVDGLPFVLGSNSVIQIGTNGTGSFSGTDVNDGHAVSGTFNCGG